MYKAIIKPNSYIQLDVTKVDEITQPNWSGNYAKNKKLVESSYSQFGHLLGPKFSIEELEFTAKQLGFGLKVLEDVERNDFYQVEKPEVYT